MNERREEKKPCCARCGFSCTQQFPNAAHAYSLGNWWCCCCEYDVARMQFFFLHRSSRLARDAKMLTVPGVRTPQVNNFNLVAIILTYNRVWCVLKNVVVVVAGCLFVFRRLAIYIYIFIYTHIANHFAGILIGIHWGLTASAVEPLAFQKSRKC